MVPLSSSHLPGYLLAGGKSSRLGQEKARAFLYPPSETVPGGLTVIEAVAAALDDGLSRLTVVADRVDKYADLGLETIADETPHQGPLGGIARAAEHSRAGYFFVASCDRVNVESAWIELLHQAALLEQPEAVAFEIEGRLEPLFTIYHTALLPEIKSRLRRGERAVYRLLQVVQTARLSAPAGWAESLNINTPDELERARVHFQKSRPKS